MSPQVEAALINRLFFLINAAKTVWRRYGNTEKEKKHVQFLFSISNLISNILQYC